MEQLTAAHRTLPFQTWVEVTNLNNGKQVEVRITDRGPFVDGRVIDLSLAAARAIDMVLAGVVPVRLRVIDPPAEQAAAPSAPSSTSLTSDAGYAVQAGAFADQTRAVAVRDSLAYPDVRVIPTRNDPPLWRVVIGHNLDMDAATQLAHEVEQVTGEAFVVGEP